jgi:flagellar FliL protein
MKKFHPLVQISLALLLLMVNTALTSCSSDSQGAEPSEKLEKAALSPTVMGVGTFIINLDLKKSKVVKLSLNAELSDPAILEKAKQKAAALRDSIFMTVSAHTYEELMTPEGKDALKKELNSRFNSVLGEEMVRNVYITEFIVQ